MTNLEKQELRELCKQGLSFEQVRRQVNCADSTIRQYLRVFAPTESNTTTNYQQKERGDE